MVYRPSIGLAAALFCVCRVSADGNAASEVKPALPDFSPIDMPWVAIAGQEYGPPAARRLNSSAFNRRRSCTVTFAKPSAELIQIEI